MMNKEVDEDDSQHSSDAALTRYLREEAYAVRDCFTRYSIQILAVSGGLVLAIAKFQLESPYLGLLIFFPILLIFTVLQMGVHKYATSNRLLGFELHLQRTAHYISRDHCHDIMRKVGWEEAMRAWRLVQPTLWDAIYHPMRPRIAMYGSSIAEKLQARTTAVAASILGRWISHLGKVEIFEKWLYRIVPRPEIIKCIDEELKKAEELRDRYVWYWFDQVRSIASLKARDPNCIVSYNAGGYLRTMMFAMLLSVVVCWCLPLLAIVNIWVQYFTTFRASHLVPSIVQLFVPIFVTLIFVAGTACISLAWRNIDSRVSTLESGLLSIHSSAIVWEAIILAHLRALGELHFYDVMREEPKTMHGYTAAIVKQANEIRTDVVRIHGWIDSARRDLDAKFRERQS
jgi:hypothetical protein